MSRPSRPLPLDPRAREKATALAHAAGRLGATRVPDEAHVLLGPDPSDTAVHALLVALENGQLQRGRAYLDYASAVAEEMLQQPEAVTNRGVEP